MVAIDANRLRHELARRGMTQAQLAGRAGMTEAALSNVLRRGNVRPSTLAKLTEALAGVPVLEGADRLLEAL